MGEMDGKVCVITGANTGIGYYTAVALAQKGARVIVAGRSRERCEPLIEAIAAIGEAPASFVELELGNLDSVRRAAKEILEQAERIDVLINNAGVGGAKGQTTDGFEIHFGINHMGHFLLTDLLLDRIKASAPARIVTVASKAHFQAKALDFEAVRQPTRTATGFPEYAVSKLANVLFSAELHRRLEGSGVSTYSVHPGTVATDIWRTVPAIVRPVMKWFMLSSEEGAKTSIHCASDPSAQEISGKYWDACKAYGGSKLARDEGLAKQLWEHSERWCRPVD
jgi:retinol dehydrogenase 12